MSHVLEPYEAGEAVSHSKNLDRSVREASRSVYVPAKGETLVMKKDLLRIEDVPNVSQSV